MKGIILAGGKGTRLFPMTSVINKQLIPIYDKPAIYYPLSLLMLCYIREILIITNPEDIPSLTNLLGDGSQLGINISYKEQPYPNGLSEAFIIGKDFVDQDDVMLILGDNLFHGNFDVFRTAISSHIASKLPMKATIFPYKVKDPRRYGVVDFNQATGKAISLEEKPQFPKSNYAISGIYIFDKSVCSIAAKQEKSARGELEIVDTLTPYLNNNSLSCVLLKRGMAWLDTGTPESLQEAGLFISAIEKRQGLKVACLEEISLLMKLQTAEQMKQTIEKYPDSNYRLYIEETIKEIKERA